MLSLKSSLKLKWEKVLILLLLLPCLCASMGYILIWNALKGYLGKKHEFFFLWSPSFVCCTWSVYRSAPILRNLFCLVHLQLLFYLSSLTFVPISTWVFANLPIYRKLIHNICLFLENQESVINKIARKFNISRFSKNDGYKFY